MGDHIVQLARDPGPFLRDQLLDALFALALELPRSIAEHLNLPLTPPHRAPTEPCDPGEEDRGDRVPRLRADRERHRYPNDRGDEADRDSDEVTATAGMSAHGVPRYQPGQEDLERVPVR